MRPVEPDAPLTLEGALWATRLIVSVQAPQGTELNLPEHLIPLAGGSLAFNVRALRLEGVENVRAFKRSSSKVFIIGLIKTQYLDCPVYITPTLIEVEQLIETGCDAIAYDATLRPHPLGTMTAQIVARIHEAGRIAVADIDTVEAAHKAQEEGADAISTTLAGYTNNRARTSGPDLDLLRELALLNLPMLLAEGRFTEHWQVEAALRIGAHGVVVGGAINDPAKNTERLLPHGSRNWERLKEGIAAFDIGGTWLRFGEFSKDGDLVRSERVPLPSTRRERFDWMRETLRVGAWSGIGVSTGGIVDGDGIVTHSKPSIPDNVGTDYRELEDIVQAGRVFALNDGLATAWGHGCHPLFAGRNVVTLAIGTGVGCGQVREGRIIKGPNGEPPHLNDLPAFGGKSFEELLGGASVSADPTEKQKADAQRAADLAIRAISTLMMPDDIVVCGSIGLQDWLSITPPDGAQWQKPKVHRSPYGADAGLYGAAALAMHHHSDS